MSWNFIREYFQRRRVRKTFERYVSPGVIRLIEKEPRKYFSAVPERKHFQFVIVLIDESKPDEVSDLQGKLVDICLRHWMVVDQVFFTLLTAHLGKPFEQHDNPENRMAVVNELVRECSGKIRIAHGECTGLIGNFGSQKRFAWGALIPNFLGILRNLLDTPAGTVIEIPEVKAKSAETAEHL
jgi:hypothetical protein